MIPSAARVRTGGGSLAVRREGLRGRVPIVLVHGLGQTLQDWPEALISSLVGVGRHVVTFDHRDVGHSSRFDGLGRPPLLRLWLSRTLRLPALASPPYTLEALSEDLLGLLDGLGVAAAHLVGVSMGGMIAQRLAASAPQRIVSLVSIMSSSGAPGLPGAEAQVWKALTEPPPATFDAAAHAAMAFRRLVAGPLAAADIEELQARVARSVRYGWPSAAGAERQFAAILADRDRWRRLPEIVCPALVIHGEKDPFVPVAHGADTARRIPGARFVSIADMGHEITLSNSGRLASLIIDHALAAERQSSSTGAV